MKKVVVGGTFDLFHQGHKEFLKKADSLGDLKVGLTSDDMAKRTKGVEVEPFENRNKNIRNFLEEVKVEKIDEPFAFALHEDFDYIVVSQETLQRGKELNEKRKEAGKEEIEIVVLDFVLAEDDKPISSTRIRNKEIDGEGNLIK